MSSRFRKRGEALDVYLDIVASHLGASGIDWAIGGAIAQTIHGYERATTDLDVFVHVGQYKLALASLRGAGMQIETLMPEIHYAAHLPKYASLYPEVRIDVLVPSDDPEWSAVAVPDEVDFEGLKLNVFPVVLLALTRFYSDQARHAHDLAALVQLKLFDPREAREILTAMDPERLPEWEALMVSLAAPKLPRQKPNRRTWP